MTETERLLDDVLAEPTQQILSAGDPVLARTLLEVRRHRTWRRRRSLAGAAVAMAALIGLTLFQLQPRWAAVESSDAVILRSRPLPPGAWLITRSESAPTVRSSSGSVELISTARLAELPRIVSDDELLQLAQAEPAALIRRADGRSELVLLAGRASSAALESPH